MTAVLYRIVKPVASLRLTVVLLAITAAVALAGETAGVAVGPVIAMPLGGMVLNLLAAIATNGKLRRQAGLLGFHLCLAALALLAALDRLTALEGHVEVSEGAAFDPALAQVQAGPWHWGRLADVRFVQGPFEISYAPGVKRRETFSTIRVPDADGQWHRVVVGDDKPLVAGSYRLYTSFNKGFAPILSFVDHSGRSHRGAVHLPSYPLNDFRQGNDWVLPGTDRTVKLWLSIGEPIVMPDASWRFHKPKGAVLVLIEGDKRRELAPGDSVTLGDGVLRYEELGSWMGYTISYNPFGPWMLAACLAGILFFAWHVFGKLWRRPVSAAASMGMQSHAV